MKKKQEKTKKEENTGKSTERYFVKKQKPLFFVFAFLLVVAGVGVPLCVIYHVDWALYAISGLVSLGIIICFLVLTILSKRYRKELDSALDSMDKQLTDFSKGDIRINSVRHPLPTFDKLQSQLNSAISRYSQYRLVYDAASDDAELKKKIESGTIFSYKEFSDLLLREVQHNLSFRSAVLFIEAMGSETISDQSMIALHQKIMSDFPSSLVGQYDKKTFVIYDYSVDSFLGLQNLCEKFVTSFNELAVSSFEEASVVNYCRIGGVVYPYTPMINLLEDGLSALNASKDVNINVGVRSVYYPHAILSETNKRVIYLASIESFQDEFRHCKTVQEQLQTMQNFTRWFAVSTNFDLGGILLYSANTNDYTLALETGKDPSKKAFSLLGERIPASQIDLFYDAALKDGCFSSTDVNELPASMSSALINLGIRSFFFQAITYGNEKRGLIYFTSSSVQPFFSLLMRENLEVFCSLCSSLMVSLESSVTKNESSSLLESLASRSNKYVYTIDRSTHRLTYLSENLKHCFPNAKVGDICYKDLRTAHTAPCSKCPLTHGVDHRIIEHISPLESSVSVLQYRGAQQALSSIIIEQLGSSEPGANAAGNHLVDKMLLIKNVQALSLDVSHQIKLGFVGYVVSAKLIGAEEILKKNPSLDQNALMASVAKCVQDAGYGDLLYRYDTFELSFLLKSYTKAKIMDFVEEIAQLLSGELEVQTATIHPTYAFSAISYPNEAETSKELIPLIRSELKRSEGFGEGYLAEVASRHPRRALRSDYILDVLNETISKDAMKVQIQPVYDQKSGKIIIGDIFSRLFGRDGVAIPPNEFIPIASSQGLISKIDLAALNAAGRLFENYEYSYFKNAGVKHLSVVISQESLVSPTFLGDIKKSFDRYKIPKDFIILEISYPVFESCLETIKTMMPTFNSLGVILEIIHYHPEQCSFDPLKQVGVTHIKTAQNLIGDAIETPSDYGVAARFVDAALRAGYFLTMSGIETSEESELSKHFGVQCAEGYYCSKPLVEEDFIKLLSYGK